MYVGNVPHPMIWDVFAPSGRPEGLRRTNEPLASRPNVRQKRTESYDLGRVCSSGTTRGFEEDKRAFGQPSKRTSETYRIC